MAARVILPYLAFGRGDMSTIFINSFLQGNPWYLSGGAPDPIAVYQPAAASSLAESYTDYSGNGNDLAPGVAPTWSALTGWTGDGTKWLDTGIVAGNQYAILVRFSGYLDSGNNAALAGCFSSSAPNTGIFVGKTVATQTNRFRNGDSVFVGAGTQTAGVMAVAGGSAYFNGVEVSAGLGGNGSNGLPIYILAARNTAGPVNIIRASIQYVVIYDDSTDHDVWLPQVSAAMAGL